MKRHYTKKWMKTAWAGILTGFFLVLVSSISFAEEISLTLEEAIAAGLENSLAVKSKRLAVSAAGKDVASAYSAYYPGIDISAGYTGRFDENARNASTSLSDPDKLDLSIELVQPIYTFGRLNASVEAAKKAEELAAQTLEEQKRSLAVDIRRAFYGYLLAEETLSVKEQSLSYREEAVDIARARYDTGLATRREVLQAESDLAGFIPELISARNDVDYAILKLKDITGIDQEAAVTVRGELSVSDTLLDTATLLDEALFQNSGIRQYDINIALQKVQKTRAEAEKLPSISGFASVSLQNGFDIGGTSTLADGWDNTVSAGVKISMDLSSLFPWSGETAEVEKSGIELQRMNTERKSLKDDIRLKIESILLDLSEGEAMVRAGEKALELAQELFLSTKEMYENGLISLMDYEDAQLTLKDSRAGYLSYLYNYRMLLCDLMDAAGVDSI